MPKRRGELRDFVSGFTGGWKMMADAQHQKVIQDYYKSKADGGKPSDEALGLTGGGGFFAKMLGDNAGNSPLAEKYANATGDDKIRIRQEALAEHYRSKGDVANWAKTSQDAVTWDKMNKALGGKAPYKGPKIEGAPANKAPAAPANKPVVKGDAAPVQSEEERWKSRTTAPTQDVAGIQPNEEAIPTEPSVDVAEVDTQAMPEVPMDDAVFAANGGMIPTRYAAEGGPMEDDQSPLGALQQYERAKEAGAIPTTPAPAAPPVTPGSVDPLTRKEYSSAEEPSFSGMFNLSKLGVAIGLKNIDDDLKSDAALPAADPNRQAKVQAVSNNVGRYSNDEIKMIDAKIDPNNELPPDAKSHARMAAALTHFKNDPEAGKTMLSRLIMTDKFASQTRGALALQALQNNDVQSAAKLIADAYNMNDYDGRKMTPVFNRDGTVTANVTQDGKVVDSVTANKQQMVQLASNVASGDEFLRRAAAVAQAYRDAQKEYKGTGGAGKNKLTPKDVELLKKSGINVDEDGETVPMPAPVDRTNTSAAPAATTPAAIPPGNFNRSNLPVFASGQNLEDYNTQPGGIPLARIGEGPEGQGTALPSFAVPSSTEGAIPAVTPTAPANPPAAVPSGTASPQASAPTVTPAELPAPAGGQGGPAPTNRQSAIPTTPSGLPPQVRGPATENGEYRGTFEPVPFNKPEPVFDKMFPPENLAAMSPEGRKLARQKFNDFHKSWADEKKEHIKGQDERRKTELAYSREVRSAALADIRTKENAAIADARSQDAAKRSQEHDQRMEEIRQRNALFVEALKAKKPLDFNKNDQDDLDKFQGHVETVIKDALTNATDSKGKPANIDPEKFNTFYPVKQVRMMRDATVDLHRYNNMTPETAANVVLSMTNPGMQGAIDSSVAREVPRQMPFEANYNGSTDNDKVLEGRAPNSVGLSQYTIQAIPQTPYDSPNDPRVFVRFKDNSGPLTGVILPQSAVNTIDTVRGQQLKRLAMEADKESSAASTASSTQRAIDAEDERKAKLIDKRKGMFAKPENEKDKKKKTYTPGFFDSAITDDNLQ